MARIPESVQETILAKAARCEPVRRIASELGVGRGTVTNIIQCGRVIPTRDDDLLPLKIGECHNCGRTGYFRYGATVCMVCEDKRAIGEW